MRATTRGSGGRGRRDRATRRRARGSGARGARARCSRSFRFARVAAGRSRGTGELTREQTVVSIERCRLVFVDWTGAASRRGFFGRGSFRGFSTLAASPLARARTHVRPRSTPPPPRAAPRSSLVTPRRRRRRQRASCVLPRAAVSEEEAAEDSEAGRPAAAAASAAAAAAAAAAASTRDLPTPS
eukprot:30493-Pelagococcus_subviridis.AAC.6